MTMKVTFKNSDQAGKKPVPADLAMAELALNLPDRKVFTKDDSGNIVELPDPAKVPQLTVDLYLDPAGTATPADPLNNDPFDKLSNCLAWIKSNLVMATNATIHVKPGLATDAGEIKFDTTKVTKQWNIQGEPGATLSLTHADGITTSTHANVLFKDIDITTTKFLADTPSLVTVHDCNLTLTVTGGLDSFVVAPASELIFRQTPGVAMTVKFGLLNNQGTVYFDTQDTGAKFILNSSAGSAAINNNGWMRCIGGARSKIYMGGNKKIQVSSGSVTASAKESWPDAIFIATQGAQTLPIELEAPASMPNQTMLEINGNPVLPYAAMTKTAYNALNPKDPGTLYVITGP